MVKTFFDRFIERYLKYDGECFRHCHDKAPFKKLLEEDHKIVAGQICRGNHVARLIYYDFDPKLNWFKMFLKKNILGLKVSDSDIRFGTRHGWELGIDDGSLKRILAVRRKAKVRELSGLSPFLIREAYWSYPRVPKGMPKKGAFVCAGDGGKKGCGRMYVREIAREENLCPICRAS